MMADYFCEDEKVLTADELQRLQSQNSRLVPEHKAKKLEIEAQRHWDLFYKRNEDRFFKDRHWTTREFQEILAEESGDKKVLLEIGCGVGNFVFPLIEENLNLFVYACDFSPRAINLVKSNKLYNENNIVAFQSDVTSEHLHSVIEAGSVDIVTLVFVLSAIHPQKFRIVIENVHRVLKPGALVLFRDYGLHDMAQIRFKAGHKIADNLYMRQDGTRSYYFSKSELALLFTEAGFDVISNSYVHRRTINNKLQIDVPRIFLQAKFRKPLAKNVIKPDSK